MNYTQSENARNAFAHQFCGSHNISGADCPNCRKPLLRFFGLDTRDSRLLLQEPLFSTLPLLFCWTCNISQEMLFYRVRDNAVELLQFGLSGVQTDFPYEDYPLFFPGAALVLDAVTLEDQSLLTRLNNRFDAGENATEILGEHRDLWNVRHQVGGEPFLTQDMAEINCLDCAEEMPFLASVANDCLDIRGLTGDEGVQVLYHYCRKCYVVAAYQRIE
ncbi:MAG: hypothetical protein ACRYFS_06950 [Janthinobacterium lividum]